MDDTSTAETYQKKYQTLNLDKIECDLTRKNLLDSFSSEYLLLPEAWKMRIQCEKNLSYSDMKILIKKALNDFYSEELFESLDSNTKELFEREESPFDRCLKFKYIEEIGKKCSQLLGQPTLEKILKDALSFPHSELQQVYNYYKRYSGKFLTKKFFLKCIHQNFGIYKKIEESENDLTKWCYWIQYTKDNRFIIQNFECRIAKNPFENRLWKNYMLYLLSIDKRASLEVYHRYRRIFLDDKITEKLFLNLKAKATFYNINFLEQSKFKRPYLKRRIMDSSLKNLNIFKKQPKIQYFSFRGSFLNYFIKNASRQLSIKLFQSCKQLYFLKKIPFCHSIFVGGNNFETKYFKDSLFFTETLVNQLPNLCLEENLVIEKCSNHSILSSSIIPKLKTCNIEYANISNQQFSTSEYDFLTKSETIKVIIFSSVTINDKNGNSITLHDLLKNLTKAYHMDIPIKISITDETALNLTKMKWKKPGIGYLNILISDTSLNLPSIKVVELCTKNKRSEILIIRISWDNNVTDEELTPIEISIHNALHDWKVKYPNEKALLNFKRL